MTQWPWWLPPAGDTARQSQAGNAARAEGQSVQWRDAVGACSGAPRRQPTSSCTPAPLPGFQDSRDRRGRGTGARCALGSRTGGPRGRRAQIRKCNFPAVRVAAAAAGGGRLAEPPARQATTRAVGHRRIRRRCSPMGFVRARVCTAVVAFTKRHVLEARKCPGCARHAGASRPTSGRRQSARNAGVAAAARPTAR